MTHGEDATDGDAQSAESSIQQDDEDQGPQKISDPQKSAGSSIQQDDESHNSQKTDDEFDTVEKLERTDTGFRFKVESTRGTGTRNEDTVKAQARVESLTELQDLRRELIADVTATMAELRGFQPGDEYEHE